MVIWITGLSGAGKSTIAAEVYRLLRQKNKNIVFLDGDTMRMIWGDDLGHDIEGRRRNAERLCHLSQFLDSQGIHIVAAVLFIFPDWRQWNRENLSRYFEVFVDVPMDVLRRRDKKGLYAGAERREIPNVVGVDIPFPRPENPDLTLDNSPDRNNPAVLANLVLDALPPLDDFQR